MNRLKIELALVMLVGVSVLINYVKLAGGPEMLMITMSVLAGFYFLSTYLISDVQSIFAIIAIKVLSIASSVCIIALLFTALKLSGASELLLIGAAAIGPSALIIAYYTLTTEGNKLMPLLIRALILGCISVSTMTALLK